MSEEDQKALTEIYKGLADIITQLRDIAARYPFDPIVRSAKNSISVAMDLIEIDMAD